MFEQGQKVKIKHLSTESYLLYKHYKLSSPLIIGPCKVEDRHEIVADHFHAEFTKVADTGLIILDQCIPGGKSDLDIVMHIDRLHAFRIETVRLDLLHHFADLVLLPDLSRHLVMQCPHNAGNSWDLFNVSESDRIISFTVPSPAHL